MAFHQIGRKLINHTDINKFNVFATRTKCPQQTQQ